MRKVQAVVRRTDREPLLQSLHELGVLHITPVNPTKAIAAGDISQSLDNVRRAIQVLAPIEPVESVSEIAAAEVVQEVLSIQRSQAEYDSRLTSLYRQLEQQSLWGNITLQDLEDLKSSGALPEFFVVTQGIVNQIQADFYSVIGNSSDGKVIVAVIDRTGTKEIPPDAEAIPLPSRDNPSILREAAEIETKRQETSTRLGQLAHLLPDLQELQSKLEEEYSFSVALNSGLEDEELFAIEGWIPEDRYASLPKELDTRGVIAALRGTDPEEDESPPTLIKYPSWTTPIKGLFDMLNTFPGYREMDLSIFFMIAMPIFAAMLIGDGGYGLLFVLFGFAFYGKLVDKMGREGTQLFIIFGAVTLVWGILSANFFGITPETMARAGGFFIEGDEAATYAALKAGDGGWATVGQAMMKAPLWDEDSEKSRELLIQISFLIGCTHLVSAHLRRALDWFPDQRALADVGWSIILVSMLGVIWQMFFENIPVPGMVIIAGLAGGLALVVLFGSPNPNPVKRVLFGFASSLLPLIGTFGDTMSYIRLMAVGMASYYIAFAFNDLGATIAGSAMWLWALAAPIIVVGHLLNIILCIIAIFAHGVRLNMLEFSGNAGVQWAGHAYAPFAKIKT